MSGYPSGFWITAKGEKIAIKDLTDNHLLNIKRFIEREAERLDGEWVVTEQALPGDHWVDYCDLITAGEVKEHYNYDEICEEIKRRELL